MIATSDALMWLYLITLVVGVKPAVDFLVRIAEDPEEEVTPDPVNSMSARDRCRDLAHAPDDRQ